MYMKRKLRMAGVALAGRSLGVRVDDGSGEYRWCKDTNGAGNSGKTCHFNLRENREIKFRGYQEKRGHKSIWLQTVTFSN
jgi:hypothetical protein